MKIQKAMYEKLVRLLVEEARKGSEIRRLVRRMPYETIRRAQLEASTYYVEELSAQWG